MKSEFFIGMAFLCFFSSRGAAQGFPSNGDSLKMQICRKWKMDRATWKGVTVTQAEIKNIVIVDIRPDSSAQIILIHKTKTRYRKCTWAYDSTMKIVNILDDKGHPTMCFTDLVHDELWGYDVGMKSMKLSFIPKQ